MMFFALARLEMHPTIDYFASDHNAKCNRYYTQMEDSLSFNWPATEVVWANPPWGLWPQVVEKISLSTCAVIAVLPAWAKDWVRQIVNMSSGRLYFEPGSRLFQDNGKNANSTLWGT